MSEQPILDRAVTRRAVLVGGSLAGFAAFLAACGTKGTASQSPGATSGATAAPTTGATPAPTPGQTPSDVLNFANWTYYMDVDPEDATVFPTLEDFKAEYGTKVNYQEVIDDNDTFIGTIRPQLEAGQDTGWDLIVVTDWMAARLIRLGWAEEFQHQDVPTFVKNVQDVYRGAPFDPLPADTAPADAPMRHAPWQSGMTGLGWDSEKIAELTSVHEFFDIKYKGNIDYLS